MAMALQERIAEWDELDIFATFKLIPKVAKAYRKCCSGASCGWT
jgi:hypothetical protein